VKRCDNNERLGAVCCHKLRSSDAKAEFELKTKGSSGQQGAEGFPCLSFVRIELLISVVGLNRAEFSLFAVYFFLPWSL
jgi:hypothetical protein